MELSKVGAIVGIVTGFSVATHDAVICTPRFFMGTGIGLSIYGIHKLIGYLINYDNKKNGEEFDELIKNNQTLLIGGGLIIWSSYIWYKNRGRF